MTTMMHSSGDGPRVLFFGRHKCDASQKILNKLQRCGFDVTFLKSGARNDKLPEDISRWDGDYIICFRSFYILPDALLTKAKIAAINFHPGPPEYPGSGCINFALYDGVQSYGVTAHIMNAKVDNGNILEVRRFPVNKFDNLPTVLERTHTELYHLCSDFIHLLATQGESIISEKERHSANESWSGSARRMSELAQLQVIDTQIDEAELKRIIRATYIDGFPPKITLHGYNFFLKLEE
ncbi:MAG: hypothetical protein GY915_00870 [bacterium]|nr:hypothetical protein [bacterium]